jgi:tartrate dehydrogenase/decarboxylase / D-malate dehydrogenase
MRKKEKHMAKEMYKIAVIGGDGIGPEVLAEGIKVLNKVAELDGSFGFDFTYFPWGCEYYLKHGEMMPEDGIEQLSHFDAIYLGAVGYPGVPDHISLRGLLIKIRKSFDEYVNLRPVKLLKGAPCPLNNVKREDIDMLFVRENSEGEYTGAGAWLYKDTPREVVIQDSVFSRFGTERIIRYAFELARKEHKSLTSISKGNALNYSMVFWDQIFAEVGKEYPDVETHSYLVDAASMFMVKDPKRYGIIVCSNLFGDILTDLGAAISGGMGLAAGANLNPERKYPSMFEPIHGSAPDIAGQGKANPLASIWSASQMLDFFGHQDWGKKLIDIIEEMMVEKKVLTPDMGGTAHHGRKWGTKRSGCWRNKKTRLLHWTCSSLVFICTDGMPGPGRPCRSSLSSSPTENRSRVWVMPFSSASSGVRSAWVWVMRIGQQAFGATQAFGELDQPEALQDGLHVGFFLHVEGDHAPEAAGLLLLDGVAGMLGQARDTAPFPRWAALPATGPGTGRFPGAVSCARAGSSGCAAAASCRIR